MRDLRAEGSGKAEQGEVAGVFEAHGIAEVERHGSRDDEGNDADARPHLAGGGQITKHGRNEALKRAEGSLHVRLLVDHGCGFDFGVKL